MSGEEHESAVREVDRERAVMRIQAAVEAGVLDVAEAGRRLSAVHRAPDQQRLHQLVADLDFRTRRSTGRAVLVRAGVQILLLALVAVLLVHAFLQLTASAAH
ncbi:DUF1707 domain-containing protein [Pseudonocardia adelaidensis]|uniref:DUF1707 domain-containing protein n=1 Tax=Pseudonocardia adelaidensis TaxID=648754 RepID=A0ABP9P1N7_9PSEU